MEGMICRKKEVNAKGNPNQTSLSSKWKLITYIKDRPGHDRRYAIDATKINKELGWKPSVTFEEGIALTIDWYLQNTEWLQHVTSGAYQNYYQDMYQDN